MLVGRNIQYIYTTWPGMIVFMILIKVLSWLKEGELLLTDLSLTRQIFSGNYPKCNRKVTTSCIVWSLCPSMEHFLYRDIISPGMSFIPLVLSLCFHDTWMLFLSDTADLFGPKRTNTLPIRSLGTNLIFPRSRWTSTASLTSTMTRRQPVTASRFGPGWQLWTPPLLLLCHRSLVSPQTLPPIRPFTPLHHPPCRHRL